MRVLGVQVWPIKAYSPFWYLLVLALLLLGCGGSTEPDAVPDTVGMIPVPTEAAFGAAMRANGYAYGQLGICDPGKNGTVADVHLCFGKLFEAMGVSGISIGTCAAAAGGTASVATAIGAWSACGYGLFKAGQAYERWVDATDIGRWANQSAEEIANRMRQVIYERMVARGQWSENAGCC